jgi:hypothetical protein
MGADQDRRRAAWEDTDNVPQPLLRPAARERLEPPVRQQRAELGG